MVDWSSYTLVLGRGVHCALCLLRYLSNLPKDMDEEGLTQTLLSCLKNAAEVISCRVLRDTAGNSRGVGLARMNSRNVCETVIKRLNGVSLPGRTEQLRVKFANGPSPRKFKMRAFPGGPPGAMPFGAPMMGPGGYPLPYMTGPPPGHYPGHPGQWVNGGMMPYGPPFGGFPPGMMPPPELGGGPMSPEMMTHMPHPGMFPGGPGMYGPPNGQPRFYPEQSVLLPLPLPAGAEQAELEELAGGEDGVVEEMGGMVLEEGVG
jgi:hypothetical protein